MGALGYLTGQGAHREYSSFFFAAEAPEKKNDHALQARPHTCKELTRSVRASPFPPSSAPSAEKGKLFPSAISVLLVPVVTGRAVRHWSIPVAAG